MEAPDYDFTRTDADRDYSHVATNEETLLALADTYDMDESYDVAKVNTTFGYIVFNQVNTNYRGFAEKALDHGLIVSAVRDCDKDGFYFTPLDVEVTETSVETDVSLK